MAQTLAQITKQIEKLQKEANALRQTELKGVVDRIKTAISHYGLTPDQLGFGKPAAKSATGTKTATKSSSNAAGPRFANDDGQIWSGRGPRPRWVREALAKGRSLQEFSTDPKKRSSKAAATSEQDNAAAAVAPPAKAKTAVKRAKVSTKKAGVAAKPARSMGSAVPADVSASSASVPNAKRQVKANPTKPARAKKAPATKASTVAVKSAPQPKAKRRSPVSAAAAKVAAAPSDAKSSGAAQTAVGA